MLRNKWCAGNQVKRYVNMLIMMIETVRLAARRPSDLEHKYSTERRAK